MHRSVACPRQGSSGSSRGCGDACASRVCLGSCSAAGASGSMRPHRVRLSPLPPLPPMPLGRSLSLPPTAPQLLMLAPLFCTMMAGPSGLLLYLALIRPWFSGGRRCGEAAKEE